MHQPKKEGPIIPNREILPLIEESIRSGVPVRLTVRGGSMRPLLRDGKDVVTLYPCVPEMLKKGDVVFFRYRGSFVLHRIVRIGDLPSGTGCEETVMVTRGDAMKRTEVVTLGDVIALAELPRLPWFRRLNRYARYFGERIYSGLYARFSRVLLRVRVGVFFLVLCRIGLSGCSTEKAGDKKQGGPVEPVFSMTEIPAVIASPEARAEYLAVHYWDRFSFSDTTGAWRTEDIRQAFLQYLNILHHSGGDAAARGIRSMLERSAGADTAKLNWFREQYRVYLDDPNSPLRDENLYIPVLEFITTCDKIDPAERIRPAYRLRMARKNRTGSVATDFSFKDRGGRLHNLHAFRAEYILLCFYNPGCQSCAELKMQLASSAVLQNLQKKQGALKVLMIYPEPDAEAWEKEEAERNSTQWVAGYDPEGSIMTDELYDLRAIPTIYLLDGDKKVLLKDAPFQQVEFFLGQWDPEAASR